MLKRWMYMLLGLVLLSAPVLRAEYGGDIGDTPPNFTLPDIDGNNHTLYDYLDNPAVLVYFWCEKPCGNPQGKLDSLQTILYDVYHNQGFELLAINCGDGQAITQYWASVYSVTYPMLYVEGDAMTELLNAYEIPIGSPFKPLTDELIDGAGDTVIYYRARPPQSKLTSVMIPYIEELLSQGIAEVAQSHRIGLSFSNPIHQQLNLQFSLSEPTHISLSLYDITGCLVDRWKFGVLSEGEHSIQRSIVNFATGVYFLHVDAGEFSGVHKMVLLK